ncbi:MAG: hypothetical protein AAFO96_24620 [Bacteroidota bacterium]
MQTKKIAQYSTYQAISVIPPGLEPGTCCLAYHYSFHCPQMRFDGLDHIFTISGAARMASTDPPYQLDWCFSISTLTNEPLKYLGFCKKHQTRSFLGVGISYRE